MNLSTCRLIVGSLAAFFCCTSALAQAWPDREITLLVPFEQGAFSDALARLLGVSAQPEFGQARCGGNTCAWHTDGEIKGECV